MRWLASQRLWDESWQLPQRQRRVEGAEELRAEELRAEGLRAEELGMMAEGLRAEEVGAEGLRVEGLRAEGLRPEGLGAEELRVAGVQAHLRQGASDFQEFESGRLEDRGHDGLRVQRAEGPRGQRVEGLRGLRAEGLRGLRGLRGQGAGELEFERRELRARTRAWSLRSLTASQPVLLLLAFSCLAPTASPWSASVGLLRPPSAGAQGPLGSTWGGLSCLRVRSPQPEILQARSPNGQRAGRAGFRISGAGSLRSTMLPERDPGANGLRGRLTSLQVANLSPKELELIDEELRGSAAQGLEASGAQIPEDSSDASSTSEVQSPRAFKAKVETLRQMQGVKALQSEVLGTSGDWGGVEGRTKGLGALKLCGSGSVRKRGSLLRRRHSNQQVARAVAAGAEAPQVEGLGMQVQGMRVRAPVLPSVGWGGIQIPEIVPFHRKRERRPRQAGRGFEWRAAASVGEVRLMDDQALLARIERQAVDTDVQEVSLPLYGNRRSVDLSSLKEHFAKERQPEEEPRSGPHLGNASRDEE